MAIFLKAKWEQLIMANYAVNPAVLAPFLPARVTLDLFDGKAYVSLVGFLFKDTKLFNIPIPWFGTFEEINLRFYVSRIENGKVKRGVVFINETIPYPVVAWVANKLYKEHYTVVKTRHSIERGIDKKRINYEWLLNKKWNRIAVQAYNEAKVMETDSLQQFIFEHYYGYTKASEVSTEEYRLQHPSWLVNEVIDYDIDCDFAQMYGPAFANLSSAVPDSVYLAEGSAVAIEWKRHKLLL